MAKKNKWPRKWQYATIPREMLFTCREWKELSSAEKLIYLYLKGKFSPNNNGKIRLYHSELKDIVGFKNPNTRCKAFKGLEDKGWIIRTQIGGLIRHFNEYKLTGQYDPSIEWIKVFHERSHK